MKMFRLAIIFLFIPSLVYADIYTSSTDTAAFGLPYVVRGFRGWDDNLNNTIKSIDSALGIISDDVSNIYDGTNLIGNVNSTTISGDNLGVDGQYTFPTDAPTSSLPIISYDVATNSLKWAAGIAGSAATSAFNYTNSGTQSNIAINTAVTLSADTKRFDLGTEFASSIFTANDTGKYQLQTAFTVAQLDSAATGYTLNLVTSNKTYTLTQIDPRLFASDGNWSFNGSVCADMDANDTAYMTIRQNAGTQQTDISDIHISGFKVD